MGLQKPDANSQSQGGQQSLAQSIGQFGSQQPTQMGAQQALGQMGGGGGMNLSAFSPQQSMSYAQPYMQSLGGFGGQQMSAAQPYMQSLGGFGGQQAAQMGGFGGQQNFDPLQNLGNFGAQLMGSQQQPIMGAQGYINQAYQDARSQPTIQDFLRQQQMGDQLQQAAQFSSVPGAMQGQQNPTFAPMDRGRLPPGVPGFAEQYAGANGRQPAIGTPLTAEQSAAFTPSSAPFQFSPETRQQVMQMDQAQQMRQALQTQQQALNSVSQQAPQGLQQALNSVSQPPMMPGRPNTQQVRPENARMQAMRRIQQMANRNRGFPFGFM